MTEPDVRDEYPVTRADFEAVMEVMFALEEKLGPLGNEHRRGMYAIRCSVSSFAVHYRYCIARAEERAQRRLQKEKPT